jgi:L-ascorbate metabolism protein UlaG (beta-lactamase superfamily)
LEVLWLGHATFRITSTTGKVTVIDPFLKKNPRTPFMAPAAVSNTASTESPAMLTT